MPEQAADRFAAAELRDTVVVFRDAMKSHASRINRLNVYPVPDGDTGTNMARTLDAVVAELDVDSRAESAAARGSAEDSAAICQAIAHGSLMGARGNSGVILSQIMRGIARAFADGSGGPVVVADALEAAAAGAYQAVLKPIEGTILTVVREAATGASAAATVDGASVTDVWRAAHTSAATALANTPEQLPVLKDAGVVDAGGAGFMLFLDAALYITAGQPMPEPGPDDETPMVPISANAATAGEPGLADLRYEVMYFLDLADESMPAFKQAWGQIGDSIVVVGGDGVWNCHVHTDDIGAAIETALDLGGRPRAIRVTDLLEEVAAEHASREAAIGGAPGSVASSLTAGAATVAVGLAPVTTAVVSVCTGDGLAELFWQLGVQGIVTGGQTLNPSTAELLDAVERVNATQVVILPNNKNIIPVAEQVNALSSKTVVVVPTRSMPEALAALVVYDPEADAGDNGTEMLAAATSVETGEVTQAVRDTNSPAGPISEGDWIGLVRGDGIVAVSGSLEGASEALLDHLLSETREILTVITGTDATTATTTALLAYLQDNYATVDVEVHHGGQPLYPYLFGAE